MKLLKDRYDTTKALTAVQYKELDQKYDACKDILF